MSAVFSVEDTEYDILLTAMIDFGEGSVDVVSEVVHGSADLIRDNIDLLLPVSGRTFKGHRSGARGSQWQRYDTSERLAVTVATTAARRYLYFPDDGSNTMRHAGNQQFMLLGAEAAAPMIVDRGIEALMESFERS